MASPSLVIRQKLGIIHVSQYAWAMMSRPMRAARTMECQKTKRRISAFAAILSGRGPGHDDALSVNHFAHDAAGAVGGGHQNAGLIGREAEDAAAWTGDRFGGDFLQAAEEHVR